MQENAENLEHILFHCEIALFIRRKVFQDSEVVGINEKPNDKCIWHSIVLDRFGTFGRRGIAEYFKTVTMDVSLLPQFKGISLALRLSALFSYPRVSIVSSLCKETDESKDHIFLHCKFASYIWHHIFGSFRISAIFLQVILNSY